VCDFLFLSPRSHYMNLTKSTFPLVYKGSCAAGGGGKRGPGPVVAGWWMDGEKH
jgi:hypothetical protein